ncbi:MAG: protein-tyrosine-phosphatase [Bacteroidota bacterium]
MPNFFSETLEQYIESLTDFNAIPDARKEILMPAAAYIRLKLDRSEPVRLTFICTHNSRRSHLGQVWAQIAACYYGVAPVSCYSGGTERTACNPRTVSALARAGLRVSQISEGENPIYLFAYAEGVNPMVAFSKVYDYAPNPDSGFAAVMTCSHAEENCPFIPGAEKRLSLLYEDPKIADDTPEESEVYDVRCRQIAAEMMFVFANV